MLNSEENLRLASILACIREELRGGDKAGLTLNTQYWLALKLEEANALVGKFVEEKKGNPEDRLVIQQAKQHLMDTLGMTEDQAHKFIIKTATNNRTTKFKVSQKILESGTV